MVEIQTQTGLSKAKIVCRRQFDRRASFYALRWFTEGLRFGIRFNYATRMTLSITIPDNPSDADREAIAAPLHAYNIAHGGDPHMRSVAILLTDEHGVHVGGLCPKEHRRLSPLPRREGDVPKSARSRHSIFFNRRPAAP